MFGTHHERKKQIVGYHYTPNSVYGEVIGDLLKELTAKAHDVGIRVINHCLDMAGSNQAAYS